MKLQYVRGAVYFKESLRNPLKREKHWAGRDIFPVLVASGKWSRAGKQLPDLKNGSDDIEG